MAYQSFIYEVSEGIGTIRLNNPERLNALTFQTYKELETLTAELADDRDVKVVIITGAGRGFCSGGSVNDIIGKLVEMKGSDLYRFTRMTCNVVQNMRSLRQPIIAAVNGIAAGAGAMLALASDFRIVATSAKFAFLFVKVGLAGADMGALYLLPRIVGEARATELLFLGDPIGAEEAHRIGLATRVVSDESLMDEAYALARRLKEGPLFALGLTKTLLRMEAHTDLETALELEAKAQARCMETADFREGYRAFLEKRPPRFNQDGGPRTEDRR
ncbi:MAG TPA: enoyl-CoA hydratase family protein [Candidatus Acidoferrales bacterium]|nr:enoyl-CoA hydratase family protein [Candidatus Acidoferrales bacterium]